MKRGAEERAKSLRRTWEFRGEHVLVLRLDWWAQYLKKEKLLNATANQLRDAAPYFNHPSISTRCLALTYRL